MSAALERLRFALFVAGCVALFWQWDGAPVDWLFGLAIVVSLAISERGGPDLDIAWPQTLLLMFMTISALVTILAGGETRFFAITAYLALLSLAFASMLKRNPKRMRTIEAAILFAACVAAVLVFAGGLATQLDLPFMSVLAADNPSLRGRGLFKDPNVAGGFLACTYPLAAAYCSRLPKRNAVFFLLLATAVFGIGVLFTYSRWAAFLFSLGAAGVIVALAVSRQWRLVLTLGACSAVVAAGIAAFIELDRFPTYRYQAVQSYDEGGRFVGWRLGLEALVEAPLGTGAGSFESRTEALAAAQLARGQSGERGADESDNMLRNGALDGLVGWAFDPTRVKVDTLADPSSVTGRSTRKLTTGGYQDVVQSVAVVPGRVYSFAAQIRTDGSKARLIIHWYDDRAPIGQAGTDYVNSPSWTEAQLTAQTAPAEARHVLVFLSNYEPGEQYFAAVRMVEDSSIAPWSSSMQWRKTDELPAFSGISAHETYIRLATESGVLGFLVIFGYWLFLAWSVWRWGRTSWHWPLAFLLILMAGFVIDTLHWRLLWIYSGIVAASFSQPGVRARETELGLSTQRAQRMPPGALAVVERER